MQSIQPPFKPSKTVLVPKSSSLLGRRDEHSTTTIHLEGSHSRCTSAKVKSNNEREFNPEKEADDERYSQLQSIFEAAEIEGVGGLDIDEFQIAMKKTVGYNLSNEQIALLFMKVDANCDGVVDWEEYVTYNLLEYQEKTLMIEMLRDRPFPPETRDILCRHRDTIVRVAVYPVVHKKASTQQCILDYSTGKYVSLSKEGVVTFWTPKLRQIKSYLTHPHVDRATHPWLTDFVCMYNVGMLAVTSTDRDIIIYDVQANKFVKRYYISGIDSCITTMDYWADIKDLNHSVLSWGDTSGCVYVIVFETALKGGIFGPIAGKQGAFKKVSLPEVMKGFQLGVKGFRLGKLHENWVSQIKYLPVLDLIASCCQSSQTSMYLGDYAKKKVSYFFKVNKGLLTFDYCPENNIIATGGMDYFVRVWNPYVNSKPIVVLKGHCKPVTHLVINTPKNQIVSVDKGRNIKVFDMKDQTCVQQLSGRVVKLGPYAISSMCFNPASQKLVLATNQMVLLERNEEDEKFTEIMSHNKPIMAALYNKTFKVIVSACSDSVVSVWDLNTGEKVIQFVNAHKKVERGVEYPIEITAMAFDGPGRRLITGARDGSVKIWNFNNGNCLQQFNVPEGLDITGIVSAHHRIYVTGWCQLVHVYVDGAGEEYRKNWKGRHKDDILCMSYMSPNIIATGSYNGDIIIWSRDTGQVYCTLNANKGIKPITENTRKVENSDETSEDSKLELAASPETNSWKSFKGAKAIRTGLGLLHRMVNRGGGTNANKNPQQSTVIPSPLDHPLLPLFSNDSMSPCSSPTFHTAKRMEYDEICKNYEAAIEHIIFFETRDTLNKDTAVLATSGAEGWVRFWSIHHEGGLLGQFNAAHKIGESVHAISTDEKNEFLFTGDTLGYVKVWDITEYCVKDRHTESAREERWAKLLETFTFLRVEHMGKGTPKSFSSKGLKPPDIGKRPPPLITEPKKTLKWPLLVNSFRAHTKMINSVDFVDERRVIVTASSDCSIRVWTLAGSYIGSFGETWQPLDKLLKRKDAETRLPKDIRRVGSAKTLKVLNKGKTPKWQQAIEAIKHRNLPKLQAQTDNTFSAEETVCEDTSIEERLQSSDILGKSYKRKVRHRLPIALPKIIETPESIAVYHALPFVELSDSDAIVPNDIMNEMRVRRYGANLRDKMRGTVRRKENGPAILNIYEKVVKKPTSTVPKYRKKSSKIKKINAVLQAKAENNQPLVITESDVEQSKSRVKISNSPGQNAESVASCKNDASFTSNSSVCSM